MAKQDYSKEQITQALIELMKKFPIKDITITQVVAHAKVSRNAFYNNYKGIEDVLKDVYRISHYNTFKKKYYHLDYLKSDEFIKDIINFFEINTDLLLVLLKQDLLTYIANYNTSITYHAVKEYNDSIISNYDSYFTVYFWSKYFNIARMWIMNGKKETPEELFMIIKHFQTL